MRAFLLAAGRGTRISKSIPEIPKCTLDVDGTPLILRTIDMLLSRGIDITIVVGYKHTYIENVIKDKKINVVYNPFFDVTNSIGSLWFAREHMSEDDTIIANADVFWSDDILDMLMEKAKSEDVFMLADRRRAADGDYFFDIQDGCIRRYGKELKPDERNAEYVGIAYISRKFIGSFKNRLEEMIEKQTHNVWWENVLYSFIGQRDIKAMEVGETFWAEIDFIEDYHRINDYLKGKDGD